MWIMSRRGRRWLQQLHLTLMLIDATPFESDRIVFLCFLSAFCRRVRLRLVRHRHLCQCRSGGYRRPLTVLPVRLQAQLHWHRVPLQSPVHRPWQHLHRKPCGCGERTPILPVKGRFSERLLGCLRDGKQGVSGRRTRPPQAMNLCFQTPAS